MYARIISSSRPIVETKYPLAQNLWPRTCGPELVAQKIPQLAFYILRNPDRALPFQKPDHLSHRKLRRDCYQHVHMIGHQVPFLDLAFLALGEPVRKAVAVTFGREWVRAGCENTDSRFNSAPLPEPAVIIGRSPWGPQF